MPDRNFRSMTWSLAGLVLAAAGNDLWLNLPSRNFQAVAASLRMQAFLVYCLISIVLWGWGWVAIFSKRSLRPSMVYKTLAGIARLPQWLRRSLAVVLVIAGGITVLLTVAELEVGGMGLTILLLATTALAAYTIWSPQQLANGSVHGFMGSFIVTTAFALMLARIFSASSYPFSLGWSEGNRLWDYSLLFGSQRYEFAEGGPIFGYISPGRAIVWGLPFLFESAGIYTVRFWSQLVNIIPYTLFAYLLLDRTRSSRGQRFVFAAWGFLFLNQGPVYPHLIIAGLIMLLGLRSRNLLLGSVWVALSAYFAYYSRWSWLYAPGLWAGMMALMSVEKPSLKRADWPKLVRPLALGISGFIGGQILPVLIKIPSGTHAAGIAAVGGVDILNTEAFSQALLWDRLWPNPTFGPGIILGLFAAVGPLLFWMVYSHRIGHGRLNTLQLLGSALPTIAFLVVGVIASTKIGGGGDLHNMDMFFVAMLIWSACYWEDVQQWLRNAPNPAARHLLVYILLAMPLLYSLRFSYTPRVEVPSPEKTAAFLQLLQSEVEQAKTHGEVLFMDQRQLLTFGYIQGLPLVDEYEKKVVIDKAMSADQGYFDAFYRDLAARRFSLIVTEPIKLQRSLGEGPFAEENDVWVEWVSTYLLRYYRVLVTYKPVGVQLLVPR